MNRVLPAGERLDALDPAVPEHGQRLEVQLDLVAVERTLQLGGESEPVA